MKNLYHKVAVASVAITLGFALGANKEAKAATFTFTSTRSFYLFDGNLDGVEETGDDYPGSRYVGRDYEDYYQQEVSPYNGGEYRSFYEFNIANLPLDSNTFIKSALLQTMVQKIEHASPNSSRLQVYGYIVPDSNYITTNFNTGKYLDEKYVNSILGTHRIATFNVFPFINQKIENNDSFGFAIRGYGNDDRGGVPLKYGEAFTTLPYQASLTITTERVPEPTTIFGSALALGVGGWIKRKKSSQQNKTTSQY